MGYLLGAYGKLLAAGLVRSIQARLMSVQRQMARATREASDTQKSIDRRVREMTNSIRLTSQNATFGMQMGLQQSQESLFTDYLGKFYDNGKLKADIDKQEYQTAQIDYNNAYTKIQQYTSMMTQQAQMDASQQQQMIEQYKEYLQETQLEPLKDLEADLEQEKLSLESELKLAEQEKEACEKMEDSGVKNLVPRYTSQG